MYVQENNPATENAVQLGLVYTVLVQAQQYASISVVLWITFVLMVPLLILYSQVYKPLASPLRKIPGQSYIPIVGNSKEFFSGESMDHARRLIKKYGTICRYYFFFGATRVLVADPDIMKYMLIKNAKNYTKPQGPLVLVKKLLGNGLVLSEGKTHAVHKRLMSPAFNRTSVAKMLPQFNHYTDKFSHFWEKKIAQASSVDGTNGCAEIEVHSDFKRLTLDIIGKTAFGFEINSMENPEHKVCIAFNRMLSGGFIDWKMIIPGYMNMPFEQVRQVTADKDLMKKVIQGIIENKRYILEQGGEEGVICDDVLGNMMLARDSLTGLGLTDQELYDQVITLMVAGHETTAVALVWLLYVISMHPEVQEKIRSEISSYMQIRDANVPEDVLEQCTYLNAVIKETLRMYPPIPLTIRTALNNDEMKGYPIPKGSMVLLGIGAMMRQEEYFSEPDTFKPERFLDTDTADTMSAFLPFLVGSRQCLGYRFAMNEMKTVLSTLVRRFKFEMMPGLVIKKKFSVTMKPDPALRLKVSLVDG